LWRVHITIGAIDVQQCVLFSIVEVQNILYCLYFLGSLLPFGLERLIVWRFYVTVNSKAYVKCLIFLSNFKGDNYKIITAWKMLLPRETAVLWESTWTCQHHQNLDEQSAKSIWQHAYTHEQAFSIMNF
jgi:hypothetical protein